MDAHQMIEALLACLGAGVLWWVNSVWRRVDDLERDFHIYQLEVAEKYVPVTQMNRIMDKLDKIEQLLHTKQDRHEG